MTKAEMKELYEKERKIQKDIIQLQSETISQQIDEVNDLNDQLKRHKIVYSCLMFRLLDLEEDDE